VSLLPRDRARGTPPRRSHHAVRSIEQRRVAAAACGPGHGDRLRGQRGRRAQVRYRLADDPALLEKSWPSCRRARLAGAATASRDRLTSYACGARPLAGPARALTKPGGIPRRYITMGWAPACRRATAAPRGGHEATGMPGSAGHGRDPPFSPRWQPRSAAVSASWRERGGNGVPSGPVHRASRQSSHLAGRITAWPYGSGDPSPASRAPGLPGAKISSPDQSDLIRV
jgi:hypothetical protein